MFFKLQWLDKVLKNLTISRTKEAVLAQKWQSLHFLRNERHVKMHTHVSSSACMRVSAHCVSTCARVYVYVCVLSNYLGCPYSCCQIDFVHIKTNSVFGYQTPTLFFCGVRPNRGAITRQICQHKPAKTCLWLINDENVSVFKYNRNPSAHNCPYSTPILHFGHSTKVRFIAEIHCLCPLSSREELCWDVHFVYRSNQ